MATTAKQVYNVCVYITNATIDGAVAKVVALANLLCHLTGTRGDKQLMSLFRRSGRSVTLGRVPTDVPGLCMAAFPGQPGHASNKPMTASTRRGLEWLLREMDQETLDTHRNFLLALLTELDPVCGPMPSLQTRFPKVQMVAGSTSQVQVVLGMDRPRMVLPSLLASFAPNLHVTRVTLSLCAYLWRCNVSIPVDIVEQLECAYSMTHGDMSPTPCTTPFEDTLLPYERALGLKSHGLILGPSSYNNGIPALLADFPIVVLVLLRLRTLEARQLVSGAFHQGLVMMSGNADVAQAIASHWQSERAAQPTNALLQFIHAAVDHQVEELRQADNVQTASSSTTLATITPTIPKRRRMAPPLALSAHENTGSTIDPPPVALVDLVPAHITGASRRLLLHTVSQGLLTHTRSELNLSEVDGRRRLRMDCFGQKTCVPSTLIDVAKGLIQSYCEREVTGGSIPAPATSTAQVAEDVSVRNARSSKGYCTSSPQHVAAKIATNELFVNCLRRHGFSGMESIALLDDFTGHEGYELRSAQVLKAAGFHHLTIVNPCPSICRTATSMNLRAFQGTWEEAVATWTMQRHDSTRFAGVYLDLCSGCEDYVAKQIQVAMSVASGSPTVLAYTLLERDYRGEPMLQRVFRLADVLGQSGWQHAAGTWDASSIVYRTGHGQQVITQVWKR